MRILAVLAIAVSFGCGGSKGATPQVAPSSPPEDAADSFNLTAARSRLDAIARGVQSCKSEGATGEGKVLVVFAPSGDAFSAALVGDSPFEGTPTGACVVGRFHQAHVPPFVGGPIRLVKHFAIQ